MFQAEQTPPRCPKCGANLRPDVVWFGEMLPEKAFSRAVKESSTCDLLMSVGTSGLVYPAGMLPHIALEAGATVVEINPERSPLAGHADFVLTGAAGTIVPELVARLKNELGKSRP